MAKKQLQRTELVQQLFINGLLLMQVSISVPAISIIRNGKEILLFFTNYIKSIENCVKSIYFETIFFNTIRVSIAFEYVC